MGVRLRSAVGVTMIWLAAVAGASGTASVAIFLLILAVLGGDLEGVL